MAQLDSASDSDSEGHEFESHRVGQVESLDTQHRVGGFRLFLFCSLHATSPRSSSAARSRFEKKVGRLRLEPRHAIRVPRFFFYSMSSHATGDNAPQTARGALCKKWNVIFESLDTQYRVRGSRLFYCQISFENGCFAKKQVLLDNIPNVFSCFFCCQVI